MQKLKNFVHSVVNSVTNSEKKENVPTEPDYLIFVPIPGGELINDFVPTVSTLVRARVNYPDGLRYLRGYHFKVELDKKGTCSDFVVFAANQDYALGAFGNNSSLLLGKGGFEVLTIQGTPIRSLPESFASEVRRVFEKEAYPVTESERGHSYFR